MRYIHVEKRASKRKRVRLRHRAHFRLVAAHELAECAPIRAALGREDQVGIARRRLRGHRGRLRGGGLQAGSERFSIAQPISIATPISPGTKPIDQGAFTS
jgi:hypothetical protein